VLSYIFVLKKNKTKYFENLKHLIIWKGWKSTET